MLLLTEDAALLCEHVKGKVTIRPSQDFCRVEGRCVLVDDDPEGKPISGCPNLNPAVGIKPCTTTLAVKQGYVEFVRVGGRRVCVDALSGLTDGTPSGLVKYRVGQPGQTFVSVTDAG